MRNYLEELKAILSDEISDEEKKAKILQYHENDIAGLFDEISEEERAYLHRLLGSEVIAEVIPYAEEIEEIVDDLEPEIVAEIIDSMDTDDAVDVLEELDEETRNEIIQLLEEDTKEDIAGITKYDERVIGSRMSDNFITIDDTDTVRSAMKKVITQAAENDNVSMIFVTEKDGVLFGVLELRDLIIAREHDDIREIIKTNYPYFYDDEPVEDCLARLKDYALDAYPVVDRQKTFLGIITADDVIEVVDEELGEDYAMLAGLSEQDETDTSVFSSVKKRIPWLIILLVLSLAQAFLMTGFEAVVATLPVIVFFQTLVLGMSGNTGTQSLAVTIRMLSGESDGKMMAKTILKELRVGFLNGTVLALLAGLFVYGFLFFTNQGVNEEFFSVGEALRGAGIVGIALLCAMTLSSFVGAFVPIVFKKLKIDPAVASGPFITTVNDLTAMLIYYGLAALLFSVTI